MIPALLGFGQKYLFEIIAVVCFVAAAGLVVWKAQNWCNHACREAKVALTEATTGLNKCIEDAEKAKTFYLEQNAEWQRQVNEQRAAIEEAKKVKEAIVTQKRESFNKIFKESKTNETESKARIRADIRPADVVSAPTALVREYNAAVASGPGSPQGNRGSEVSGQDPVGTLGSTATFDAVAVAEALIGNVYKYNQLAAQCTALMEIVKELEARNDSNTKRTDGPAAAAGRDVPSRAAQSQVF